MNFLITPLDGVLTEITNDASALVDPDAEIDLAANLYFGIASRSSSTVLLTIVTARFVEGRIGPYDPADGRRAAEDDDRPTRSTAEARRAACASRSGRRSPCVAVIALLTVIPGAPLRDPETGRIIGDSPFMDSLIVIIALIFFVAGLAYGRGAGTIKGSADVLASITKSWAGLASLLFLFLLIAQFIAYFNFSNMAQVAAVSARRPARAARHRRRLAADRLHHRDDDRRPDHARGDRQVGDPGADLHPAVHPARRRARRPCSRPTASATRRST